MASGKLTIALAVLCAVASPATAEVLLDYRDPAFLNGSPFYAAPERARIAAALKEAPAEIAARFAQDFAVLGDAPGAFTEAGADERVFLVQAAQAVAIDPFPDAPRPLLVVLRGEEAVGFHSLKGDVQYQRLVTAADADGDGLDEAFLETSFTNMGQTSVSLDIVRLGADGDATVAETLREVYYDGCENPVGARERRTSTVNLGEGVTTESFSETCPQ